MSIGPTPGNPMGSGLSTPVAPSPMEHSTFIYYPPTALQGPNIITPASGAPAPFSATDAFYQMHTGYLGYNLPIVGVPLLTGDVVVVYPLPTFVPTNRGRAAANGGSQPAQSATDNVWRDPLTGETREQVYARMPATPRLLPAELPHTPVPQGFFPTPPDSPAANHGN